MSIRTPGPLSLIYKYQPRYGSSLPSTVVMINVSFPEAMRSGNSIAPAPCHIEINKAPRQVTFTFSGIRRGKSNGLILWALGWRHTQGTEQGFWSGQMAWEWSARRQVIDPVLEVIKNVPQCDQDPPLSIFRRWLFSHTVLIQDNGPIKNFKYVKIYSNTKTLLSIKKQVDPMGG